MIADNRPPPTAQQQQQQQQQQQHQEQAQQYHATTTATGTNVTAQGDPIQAAISTAAAIAASTSAAVTTESNQARPALTGPLPQTTTAAAPLHFAYPPTQQVPKPIAAPPAMTYSPVAAAAAAATNPSQFPVVFDRMKLRRGKWTTEEETYADLLIEEFEKGTVEGCENGCTLRSFLSKKLHCAPMRISKKYAGKSIGKHVFLSRSNMNGINGFKNGVQVDNRAKLKDLEMRFYKSLCQESESHSGITFLNQASFPPFMSHGLTNVALPTTTTTATTMTLPFIRFPPGSNSVSIPTSTPAHVQSNANAPQAPWTAATASAPPPPPPPPPPQQQQANIPNHYTTFQPTDQHQRTTHLHQTFMSALKHTNFFQAPGIQAAQAPTTKSPATTPSSVALPPSASLIVQAQQKPPPAPQMSLLPAPTLSGTFITAPRPLQMPAATPHAPLPAPTPPHAQARPLVTTPAPSAITAAAHPATAPTTASTASSIASQPAQTPTNQTTDIPDFLSGFEKVAAKASAAMENSQVPNSRPQPDSNNKAPAGSSQSSQYSPPFTSRSFDDLHRYLGKGLSPQPFDLTGKPIPPTGPDASAQGPVTIYTSSSLRGGQTNPTSRVSADSYALFAQESALAVSHHSAYCRSEGINPGFLSDAPSPEATPAPPGLTTPKPQTAHSGGANVNVNMEPVVNEANLRAHAVTLQQPLQTAAFVPGAVSVVPSQPHINVVSGSEKSASDATTEDESAIGSSRGSVSEGNTGSDNGSDNSSNESDGPTDEPVSKKRRLHDQRSPLLSQFDVTAFSPSN